MNILNEEITIRFCDLEAPAYCPSQRKASEGGIPTVFGDNTICIYPHEAGFKKECVYCHKVKYKKYTKGAREC